jgi:hypothetical protein
VAHQMTVASSTWTATSTHGSPVKYCTSPTSPGERDEQVRRGAGRALSSAQRDEQPAAGRCKATRSACSQLSSRSSRGGRALVAGVGARVWHPGHQDDSHRAVSAGRRCGSRRTTTVRAGRPARRRAPPARS